jgi:MSHA biogenesis protein MshP
MKPRRRESGFALVVVIFILVILASAGGAMLNIASTHQASATMALLGTKAYHAARSGTEWALHQAANGGGCPAATFSLTEGGAAGFDVEVTCTSSTHVEGATSISTLHIASLARYGSFGDRDYVSRTLKASVLQ